MTEALLIAVLIVGIADLALVILLISSRKDAAREIDRLKRDMLDEQRALRAEVSENTRRSINAVGETLLNEYQRDTLNQEQRFNIRHGKRAAHGADTPQRGASACRYTRG